LSPLDGGGGVVGKVVLAILSTLNDCKPVSTLWEKWLWAKSIEHIKK